MVKLNRKMIITISSYVLVALIVFSITYGVVKFRQNNTNGLIVHGPIIILSDSDFEVYDFPGEGTIESPYLIQNYNITTNHSESIYISGTTKHFIIQNCYLRADFKSLFIENIANNTAKIQENKIISERYNNYGISLINSNQVIIENNRFNNKALTILWGATSLEIRNCEGTVIKNNNFLTQRVTIEDSKYTIMSNNLFKFGSHFFETDVLLNSPHVIFCDNTFTTESANVYIYSYNNTFSRNYLQNGHIHIDSLNSTIKDNWLNFGGYYIDYIYADLDTLRSYVVQNNTVQAMQFGYFVDSEEITISSSNYGQLYFVNCQDVTVSGFSIASYRLGIIVAHCKNVFLEHIGLATSPYSPEQGIEFYNSTECEVQNVGLFAHECVNVIESSNISIRENFFGWSGYGVRVSSSTDVLISNNQFDDQQDTGIYVDSSEDVLIANNTLFTCVRGISVFYSSNVSVASNKIDVSEERAILAASNNEIHIYDNSIWGGNQGIYSENSRNSTIANNRIKEIYDACISLYNDDNLTVVRNNCGDSKYGLHGTYLWDTLFDNNEIHRSDVGLLMRDSYNCTISRTFSDTSITGIWIIASSELLVKENTILNADSGIYAASSGLYSYYGVMFSIFENNTCMYGEIGISISDSTNCSFVSNQLDHNNNGLYFQNVVYSSVLNNSCSFNNEFGIWIQDSDNCTFSYNLIQNNTLYGVNFESCRNNTLYHNAFLYNNEGGSSQAYDDTGTNFWYLLSLSEGNYWSGWNSGLGAYSIDGPGSATDPFPLDVSPL